MATLPKTEVLPRRGTTRAERTMAKEILPKDLLERWLDGRYSWNHEDWLALLATLRTAGYAQLTDTTAGQTAIGQYLETHRR